MDELLFIETIRVEDGIFVRPELHLHRMRQTVREAYGVAFNFDLADGSIPLQHRKGTVKCRIVYGRSLSEISFAPYVPREIRSLRLVAADDELDYHLKYADRSALARLLQRRDDCDEILIPVTATWRFSTDGNTLRRILSCSTARGGSTCSVREF